MNLLSLATLLKYAPAVISFVSSGFTPASILAKLPDAVDALNSYVETHYPKVAPAERAIAAIALAYNPDRTRWLQGALNKWKPSLRLGVDGIYGPATRNAAEQFQSEFASQFGLKIDGWIGDISMSVIEKVLGLTYPVPKTADPQTA